MMKKLLIISLFLSGLTSQMFGMDQNEKDFQNLTYMSNTEFFLSMHIEDLNEIIYQGFELGFFNVRDIYPKLTIDEVFDQGFELCSQNDNTNSIIHYWNIIKALVKSASFENKRDALILKKDINKNTLLQTFIKNNMNYEQIISFLKLYNPIYLAQYLNSMNNQKQTALDVLYERNRELKKKCEKDIEVLTSKKLHAKYPDFYKIMYGTEGDPEIQILRNLGAHANPRHLNQSCNNHFKRPSWVI